jgi:hypothetical protein
MIKELALEFAMSSGTISDIIQTMEGLLYVRLGCLIHSFDGERILLRLDAYAAALAAAGSPISGIISAVDACCIPCGKPSCSWHDQDYNGHYRAYSRKVQGFVTSDGFLQLSHDVRGCMHDSRIFRESGLLGEVEEALAGRPQYCLYGDGAYAMSRRIIRPFVSGRRGAGLTEGEREFNKRMSSVRVMIENTFGDLVSNGSRLPLRENKVRWTRPGLRYIITRILHNLLLAAREGNVVSYRFGVDPMRLEEYVRLDPRWHPSVDSDVMARN